MHIVEEPCSSDHSIPSTINQRAIFVHALVDDGQRFFFFFQRRISARKPRRAAHRAAGDRVGRRDGECGGDCGGGETVYEDLDYEGAWVG